MQFMVKKLRSIIFLTHVFLTDIPSIPSLTDDLSRYTNKSPICWDHELLSTLYEFAVSTDELFLSFFAGGWQTSSGNVFFTWYSEKNRHTLCYCTIALILSSPIMTVPQTHNIPPKTMYCECTGQSSTFNMANFQGLQIFCLFMEMLFHGCIQIQF